MVGIIFELRDFINLIKWGTRIGLIIFFLAGAYLLTQGTDIFFYLQKHHMTTTLTIAFLSGMAFLPWIVPKPKKINKNGGEEAMNKFHLAIVFIISILVVVVVALMFYTDQAKEVIGGAGGGIGQWFVDLFVGINAFLGTLEPYVNSIIFFIGGMIFVVFLVNFLIPKVQTKLHPYKPTTTYQNEPEYTPPVNLNQPKKIEEETT